MRRLTTIAVFCGSNSGTDKVYRGAAEDLGRVLAERNITLVFGGTHKGLMGALADAHLAAGGTAHGVITTRLHDKGHLHPGLSRHEIVADMGSRKSRMAELAEAFIALPGGIGTLEEFVEAMTLNQLGYMDKPTGLLNVAGFYDGFLGLLDTMIDAGFLPAAHRANAIAAEAPEALLDAMDAFVKTDIPKWL